MRFSTILIGWTLISSVCFGQAGWVKTTDGPVLPAIRADLRSQGIMSGEDTVGQGHYGGHGMNSQLRNQYGSRNGSYLPGGWSFIAPEPRSFTLSEVISRSPVRGQAPALATSSWNNQPLYLLDELSAYTCGTIAGIEAGQTNSLRTRTSMKYATVLLHMVGTMIEVAQQKGYPHVDQLLKYQAYVTKLHKERF